MIEGKNVGKVYSTSQGPLVLFRKLSFSFPHQGLFFIVGPSGSGKSTFLALLAGLESPETGTLSFGGHSWSDLSPTMKRTFRSQSMGFLPQIPLFFESLTALDNAVLPSYIHPSSGQLTRASEWFHRLQMGHLMKQSMKTLSGGERGRVALIRALLHEPLVVLADEPTAALDAEHAQEVMDILRRYAQNHLVLVATHDEQCINASDSVIRLKDGSVQGLPPLKGKKKEAPMNWPTPHALSFRQAGIIAWLFLRSAKQKTLLYATTFLISLVCMTLSWSLQSGFYQLFEHVLFDSLQGVYVAAFPEENIHYSSEENEWSEEEILALLDRFPEDTVRSETWVDVHTMPVIDRVHLDELESPMEGITLTHFLHPAYAITASNSPNELILQVNEEGFQRLLTYLGFPVTYDRMALRSLIRQYHMTLDWTLGWGLLTETYHFDLVDVWFVESEVAVEFAHADPQFTDQLLQRILMDHPEWETYLDPSFLLRPQADFDLESYVRERFDLQSLQFMPHPLGVRVVQRSGVNAWSFARSVDAALALPCSYRQTAGLLCDYELGMAFLPPVIRIEVQENSLSSAIQAHLVEERNKMPLLGPEDLAITQGFAKAFPTPLGLDDLVTLHTSQGVQPLRVRAIIEEESIGVYQTSEWYQALFQGSDWTPYAESLLLYVAEPQRLTSLVDTWQEIAPTYRFRHAYQAVLPTMEQSIHLFSWGLGGFACLSMGVALVTVNLMVRMSWDERRRHFGRLLVFGWSPRDLVHLQFWEYGLRALVTFATSTGVSWLVLRSLNANFAKMVSIEVLFTLTPSHLLALLSVSILVSCWGGWMAWRLLRKDSLIQHSREGG
jgi:putative ABC transport system ATP-binding protein